MASLRFIPHTERRLVHTLLSFAAVGVLIVGGLSEAFGLRWALVLICPTYVLGGLVVLLALRTYPRDLAFVVAEARRRPALRIDDGGNNPS